MAAPAEPSAGSAGAGQPLIDASVHVFFRSPRDLADHLREPFKSRGYPDPDVAWFAGWRPAGPSPENMIACTPVITRPA